MNLPQIFMYQGAQVRTVTKDGEPWLVAKDICAVLGIANHSDAISRLNPSMKSVLGVTDPHGRVQETAVISEPGMYKLIFRSNKPEAETFGDWVATDVLPSIRKTGSYNVGFNLPQSLPEALRLLASEIEEKESIRAENEQHKQELAAAAPKIALYDTAMSATNHMTMMHVAKTIGIGRNKLFDFLREVKVLMKNNLPYQEFIDRGYFEVRQYSITHMTSGIENKTQTLVSAKGMAYIHKLLVEHGKVTA